MWLKPHQSFAAGRLRLKFSLHEILDFNKVVVRQSLTLAKEEGQEYYVYRTRSTAENLQQQKLQLLHHNDGCGLL